MHARVRGATPPLPGMEQNFGIVARRLHTYTYTTHAWAAAGWHVCAPGMRWPAAPRGNNGWGFMEPRGLEDRSEALCEESIQSKRVVGGGFRQQRQSKTAGRPRPPSGPGLGKPSWLLRVQDYYQAAHQKKELALGEETKWVNRQGVRGRTFQPTNQSIEVGGRWPQPKDRDRGGKRAGVRERSYTHGSPA